MKTRRLWAFVLGCLLLVPCIGLCQKREAQERDINRFTFTFGLKSLFYADTEISYPAIYGNPNDFHVYYDGNLFGPVLSVQVANTETFWDNFEFVLSSYFGELDAYDSSGLPKSALSSNMSLKIADVRADICYRIISHFSVFVDYRYKKYQLKSGQAEWPGKMPENDELYGGGFGAKAGLPLGKSGVFLWASGEFMPYAWYQYDNSSAWGLMCKGGVGYSVEGGDWLPMSLSATLGYYYTKIDSNGYFDEQTDAGSADIVVSW
ncbi:MAG TPA: hypothetical protein VM163_09455 [bacterium]|nr:hypothetical protein [bacterium]